jgi:hypothetical protein
MVVTPWSRDPSGENLGRSSEEIELDMAALVVKTMPVLLCVEFRSKSRMKMRVMLEWNEYHRYSKTERRVR